MLVQTRKTLRCKLTHEARGVGGVSPDLAIDLDQALLDNRSDLLASERVLQPVTEEDREGEGFAELVGTGGGTGSLQDGELRLEGCENKHSCIRT